MADDGVAYGGGTELVAAMQLGLVAPPHLVDLKRVPELSGVNREGDVVVIGAATKHQDVADSDVVRQHVPILAEACSELGNARVRATGTIGGNLCFADPRSDVSTALFVLGASIRLRGADSERTVPIAEFIFGAMDVDLEDGELLDAVLIPVTDAPQTYLRHQPTEYPTVTVAVVQIHQGVRICVGALVERPHVFTAPSVDDVDVEAVLPDLDLVEDLNGSEPYKRHLAGVFIRRAVAQLKEAAGD